MMKSVFIGYHHLHAIRDFDYKVRGLYDKADCKRGKTGYFARSMQERKTWV